MRIFLKEVPESLEPAFKACRRHLLLAAGFSALVNTLYLAPTIYMMQIYDRVVPTGGILTLFWLTMLVAVALATLTALDGIRARVMMRASLRLNRLMAGEILDRVFGGGGKAGAAGASRAMREFDTLRQALGGQAAMAVFDMPWTPIYFIVAFIIHPILGGLVVLGIVILGALAVLNERQTKPLSERAHQASGKAYQHQELVAREAEIIQTLGMRGSLVARQLKERAHGLEAATDVQFMGSRNNSRVKFFRMFMQSAALGMGAYLAVMGQISVGAIIAASVLLNRGLQPIEQLVMQWSTITEARQAITNLAELFEKTNSSVEQKTALPTPEGAIELDSVTVRNDAGDAVLLRNVSCKIAPGEIVGIIGASGAGKTTLARVMAGALPPDLGEIRIDCAKYSDWGRDLLAPHFGYLPQSISILPGTVTENISRFDARLEYAKGEVDSDVIAAAKQAGVHEMIVRLPDGYDTMLGDAHQRLSAGQSQRLALARALYGNPRVIVLDEPNSALDAEGEQALSRAIAAAKLRGATIIVVAHRTSVLASADKLLVLADGVVADFGPRDEILRKLQKMADERNVVSMKERAVS